MATFYCVSCTTQLYVISRLEGALNPTIQVTDKDVEEMITLNAWVTKAGVSAFSEWPLMFNLSWLLVGDTSEVT